MDAHGFWTALPADGRAKIAGLGTRRTYRRGEILCREGDPGGIVLVLVRGHARIITVTPDGREVLIAVRGSGDVVGELAAIDGGPRSATVEALEAVEALELAGGRFTALCRREPDIAWALLLVLSERLRAVGKQWLDLGGGAIARRVAAQLMQLAVQHGVRRGADIEVAVPGTQAELAMTAAISRESWARVTRELRTRGVISTGRGRLTIHRMDELRRLAR
ncbi:Crp/Fnr family transcriptional regulator [Amycolatopsis sp. PS_44_ISF1]|uniref:Crp/Fnr family transcriptional regulator n=1 Tax=Amycolatopsis sp. PS_44_ISF1 TaxID=2974917 RepID=UPI0028DEA382|nr:Crp/Fnr family transcriptional regulator [Amycolatopsis sp. PS_44_ISF1]MDT8913988.1 Crp/Fnr family transcriptional regulator [Amycolatopsis sp. PS_44_ISF1]